MRNLFEPGFSDFLLTCSLGFVILGAAFSVLPRAMPRLVALLLSSFGLLCGLVLFSVFPQYGHLLERLYWAIGLSSVAAASVYIARSSALRKLERQLKVLSMAFETQHAAMITDAEGIILKVNRAFIRDTGYEAEEILGQTPRKFNSGRHDAGFYRSMMESLDKTGAWQGEIWDRRKDGEVFPAWVSISAIPNEEGAVAYYVWSHIDITERKHAEEKISYMAYHDQLTGLPNRELFYDRLAKAMSQARRKRERFALLYLDLDGFKAVNDEHGHGAGDAVLKTASNRMLTCVREADTIARLGGDELAIVLGEIRSPEDASLVAEKLAARLTEPISLQGGIEVRIGVSIGIALYPDGGKEIDSLMSAADTAMYKSKSSGKGTLVFSERPPGEAKSAPWVVLDESYVLGIDGIDRQHFELVKQLNELNAAINRDDPAEKIGLSFERLVDAVRTHFQTEERLMEELGYPSEQHVLEHRRLLDEASGFREKFYRDGEFLVLKDIKEWLLRHMLDSDKKFARFAAMKRAGAGHEDASRITLDRRA